MEPSPGAEDHPPTTARADDRRVPELPRRLTWRRHAADFHVRVRGAAEHARRRSSVGATPAPRLHELIWVDPARLERCITYFHQGYSGCIRDGDWDLGGEAVAELERMRFCRMHWEDGVSWQDTGAYDYVLDELIRRKWPLDGCRTLDDVRARYRALDEMFERVRSEGRLRTQAELRRPHFRESGGVYVHIDRHAEPVFTGHGHHRLAMARVLGFSVIPAAVGFVHAEAVDRWRANLLPGEGAAHRT